MSKCLPCGRRACAGTPLASRTSLDRHPGIPRKGSVPAYGVGLHSPICSEVKALSSLPLPLPETRTQVAARFASACLVVPLGILLPPGRSQPLPSPSPLAAFTAVRSIERLPLLGGEARRRLPPSVPGVVAPPLAGSPCRPSLRVAALSRWGGVSWPASSMKSLRKETSSEILVSAIGKQYPVPRDTTVPCPTALLLSLLKGCARRWQEPCAGLADKTRERPWLCGWGSRHE